MKQAIGVVYALCAVLGLATIALTIYQGSQAWMTTDQMGQRLLQSGDFETASESFADPFKRGVAEYRAGNFKEAAQVFAGLPDPDALFNQANARMMLGEYETAIELYQRLLLQAPEREDAKVNLKIARGRWARVKEQGGQMTGGMLGADEIVYDSDAGANKSGEEMDDVGQGDLSDEQLRGLWLREVQTTPSDFLRAKFGFQLARQNSATQSNAKEDTGR